MSWGFKCAGRPKAVADVIRRQPHFPEPLKNGLSELLSQQFKEGEVVVVESSGYAAPPTSMSATISIFVGQLAVEDEPKPAEAQKPEAVEMEPESVSVKV